MAPSDLPSGFEAFWRGLADEAMEAPLDWSIQPSPSRSTPSHTVSTLAFRGIGGETLHGWIALPPSSSPEAPAPGFLWIPPYSRWSMLPNQYGTREGFASLSFNFFGESSFHQEDYRPDRGYFAEGVESPETWIFGKMAQNAMIAARVLASIPEVDESKLASCGMSQGGGMSIWLGAWCPLIRAVCADMPFLAGLAPIFQQERAYRYPLKELADWIGGDQGRRQQLLESLRWFDTSHQARFCRVPTLLTLGRKDPAVRPEQVHHVFESLPGIRSVDEMDWGHDWHPSMVERNRDWMSHHLGVS